MILFSCGQKTTEPEVDITLTDIDGNIYRTVKIGDQLWMAENLKVTKYLNGDVIPNVTNDSLWSKLVSGAYASYDNNDDNIDIYGLLYNCYAVEDERKLAPVGWHIPTDEEWQELEKHLGMSQKDADHHFGRGTDEGGKLKESAILHWNSPNTGASNQSGFSALPGGARGINGLFKNKHKTASFWSSSEFGSYYAWFRLLSYNDSDIFRFNCEKLYGYSIRCVKD